MKNRIVVAMSGGVDSSVVAYLMKEAGHDVVALFMKNWEEDDGTCPAAADFEDVVAVCSQLDIPYYTVNFAKEYWDRVFAICLKDYERGLTPNPDILCNREIKFDLLLKKALELGAEFLATGHYCRRIGKHLARGIDENKDQSYFLYGVRGEALEKVHFPLGEMSKEQVRALARKAGLATAQKRDSTGVCFVGKRPFKPFLTRFLATRPGVFQTLEGEVVGNHDGAQFYTIGQRRGLGIGGAGQAWYVVEKDVAKNIVYVVQGDDHPALFCSGLEADEVSWVTEAPSLPLRCTAKVRYRSPDVPCTIERQEEGKLFVAFDEPQKAITPHQSIVFYDGPLCLGGALIQSGRREDLPLPSIVSSPHR